VKRNLFSLLLIGLFAACGGTSPVGGAEISGAKVTAGGCSCSAEPNQEPHISLDCYCAEFPGACLTYEQAKVSGRCFDDSRWWLMEQTGCGRLVISTGWGIGSNTLVYDQVTHEMIGARAGSDVGFGVCNTFGYSAGNVDGCSEGTVCSLCDRSGASCAPACSIEVMKSNGLGAPQYSLTGPGSLYNDCQDIEPGRRHPEVHKGCGKVTIITSDNATETFTSDTHEPLTATFPGGGECNGHWGEAVEACADETVCSLCAGAPNVCTF
jgi:hypothetical protein